VSYLGPAAIYLLTGSLVVESIFGLPGIGRYFVNAALNRDYGMRQRQKDDRQNEVFDRAITPAANRKPCEMDTEDELQDG
ncbi:hypothetical protein ACC734_39740, partial [Rhizobium ruizarguesonis]